MFNKKHQADMIGCSNNIRDLYVSVNNKMRVITKTLVKNIPWPPEGTQLATFESSNNMFHIESDITSLPYYFEDKVPKEALVHDTKWNEYYVKEVYALKHGHKLKRLVSGSEYMDMNELISDPGLFSALFEEAIADIQKQAKTRCMFITELTPYLKLEDFYLVFIVTAMAAEPISEEEL